MKITVDKKVFSGLHSKFSLAFILVKDFDAFSKVNESRHLLQEAENFLRLMYHKDTKKYHELISNWVLAMEDKKGKARHYQTSVEKLMKLVLNRRTVATKNAIENLVRYISLKYVIPYGIDDYNLIDDSLSFSIASGKERRGILRRLRQGDLYYKDAQGILGTKLDYWKSKRTALRKDSQATLIHLGALPPISALKAEKIARELANLLEGFCGAKTKVVVLRRGKKSGKV